MRSSWTTVAAVLLFSAFGVQAHPKQPQPHRRQIDYPDMFWVMSSDSEVFVPAPGGPSAPGNRIFIFPTATDCGTLLDADAVNERADVSGDKKGIRIVYGPEDESNWGARSWVEAEFNLQGNSEGWHVTWRKSDGHLKDLDQNIVGGCVEVPPEEASYGPCEFVPGFADFSAKLQCVFIV